MGEIGERDDDGGVNNKPATQIPSEDDSTKARGVQTQDHAAQLLAAFEQLLEAHRGVFKQERSFVRCGVLALGMIFSFARHTVTQCILSVGQGGRDWSSWYRLFTGQRYDQTKLDEVLVAQTFQHVPEDAPYVVVCDGTQTAHTSRQMAGCGYGVSPRSPVFARGLHVCRRWLTGAWLPPLVDGFSRAIPIQFLAAFTPKSAPASEPPRSEVAASAVFLGWLRAQLDAAKRTRQWIVVLADAAFDTLAMWTTLPQQTVLIVRTAKNRVLYELPGRSLGKGRPRLYGDKTLTPDERLHQRFGWKHADIPVRGRVKHMRYKIYGPYLRRGLSSTPLYLLVIDAYRWTGRTHHGKPIRRERSEVFYLISAVQRNGIWELPFPAQSLLAWVWQRWEVEVTHRDLKAGFGIGQMQCWGPVASSLATRWATRWAVWVFALMLLSAYRAWGWSVPTPLTSAWWTGPKRWSFNSVWRYFRIGLWQLPSFHALAAQSPSTALNLPAPLAFLSHSALAAARA